MGLRGNYIPKKGSGITPVYVRVIRTTNQSLSNGTNLIFDQVLEQDSTNSYDNTTGTFTAPVAGEYFVGIDIQLNATTNNPGFMMTIGGVDEQKIFAINGNTPIGAGSTTVSLAAGQAINIYSTATTTMVAASGGNRSCLSIFRVA